ncbi:DNA topoisomerase I [Bacillus thuringiensis]|uniref:DNA topoisomerase I n=1 Tax=Bacillus thuringiensis TaxID=1428 RepID=A0A9X6Q5V0_BACTU|nr:DNA topoisomerase I [Bacillus thuringiensis serovar aizawai]OUA11972.1 DNA topoisomerase I [Bacillus thuringiensis]
MTNTISSFENRNKGEKLDAKLSYVIQKQCIMFIHKKKK